MATKKKTTKKKNTGKKGAAKMPTVDTSPLKDYATKEGGSDTMKTLFAKNGVRRFKRTAEAVAGAKGSQSWVVVKGNVNEPGTEDHGKYSDGIFNVTGNAEYGSKRVKGKPNILVVIGPLLRGFGYSDAEIAALHEQGDVTAQSIADMLNAKDEFTARTFSRFWKDGDRYQTSIGEGVSPERYAKLVEDEMNLVDLEPKVLEHEPSDEDEDDDSEDEEEEGDEEEESEDDEDDSDEDDSEDEEEEDF